MTKVNFVTRDGVNHEVESTEGFTLMEVARRNDIRGIDADCGGACACGTCHVYVDPEWVEKTGTPDESEVAMLEFAADPQPNSRLSCQIKITAALDGLKVHLPASQH
jgi:2Fe-2S ferredoxin